MTGLAIEVGSSARMVSSPRSISRYRPIDGFPDWLEQLRGVQEAFRMAGEQQAVRRENPRDPLQHLILGRLVEIDHHIAAEDGVEGTFEIPARVAQVELAELHQLGELRAHPRLAGVRAGAAQEKALEALRAHLLYLLERVDTLLRPFQHGGIDVGGENARRRLQAAVRLAQRDGDRIRLLPRRCGSAPHAHWRAAESLDMLDQDRKVIFLAEEMTQVGGQ